MSGNIVREVVVGAGLTEENLLAGSAFEFLRNRSFVSMGIVCSAVDGFVTIQAGGNVIAEEFPPQVEALAWPQTNEDFYFNTFGASGDRLVVRARNGSAGNLTFRIVVQIADA